LPFNQIASSEDSQGFQEAFFMAASRARQLLAVVEKG